MPATFLTQRLSARTTAAVFAAGCLALALAWGFSLLACSFGLLFSGMSLLFVTLTAAAVCAIVTLVTVLVFKHRKQIFGWRTLVAEILVLTLIAVGVLSWLDTRQLLRIFVEPEPVPAGLRVHQGRSILFSSYVHFTGPATAIASLLQAKGLVEVPDQLPESSDVTGYSSRERTKASWNWWQPAAMSNPRFFFRHHQSEAVQGWSEGWWVNGATNEVYAFISG